jgi:hypothetical protein
MAQIATKAPLPIEVQINKERLEKVNAYTALFFQLYEVCKENPDLLNCDEIEDLDLETKTDIKTNTAKAEKAGSKCLIQ